MFSRWKLALETSANFVATRARNSPAPLSGTGFQRECIMGIVMNANSSDTRLYVVTDQCTIFSSANHAHTNVTSLSRLSDWSNSRKSVP